MNKQLVNEPLIMTATIDVSKTPFVQLSNPKERLVQYLCALISWINFSDISSIIFCENSNTKFDFHKVKELALIQGKELEVLVFNGNLKSEIYGKGWGEGEIIEYALEHSKLLKNSFAFYKVTGRLFVDNFSEVHAAYKGSPNVFKLQYNNLTKHKKSSNVFLPISLLKDINRYLFSQSWSNYLMIRHNIKASRCDQLVHTNFFKVSIPFFRRHLINSYRRVSDKQRYCLEHAYYDDLRKVAWKPLEEDLCLVGTSGSTGNLWSRNYTDEIRDLAGKFL